MLTGLVQKNDRSVFGENTVNSMSIDTFSWHFTLISIAVGLAYLINSQLKLLFPTISFPVYGLALICSIIVQGILKLLKLDSYVDKRIITHIGSSATDYLVAFGVASINVNVVAHYLAPIILLSLFGFVFVVGWFWLISPKSYRTYWFERAIYVFGLNTGVMATGVILLRITDPDFKTGVLEDFGFAWIFLSFVDMFIVSLSPMFVINGSAMISSIILLFVSSICILLCRIVFKNN